MKKILYVIDRPGLNGGAHIATEALIRALRGRGLCVDVLSAISRQSFWGLIRRAYLRLPGKRTLPRFLQDPFGCLRRKMCRYDVVCVMSEESSLRFLVADLPARVRKVQMIHTNYPMWVKRTGRDCRYDLSFFEKMDCIACVGRLGAEQFATMFPTCRSRVRPFYNLINRTGLSPNNVRRRDGLVRLITLGRMGDLAAKDGPRMLRVARRLVDMGVKFTWDIYSAGNVSVYQEEVRRLGLEEVLSIRAFDPNARRQIAMSDLFVLLSHYEGLPNVIYEALISGTPVFSTAVGGIPEQVEDRVTGWLVGDDDNEIVSQLAGVIANRTFLGTARKALTDYSYDEESIIRGHLSLLLGEECSRDGV